MFNEGKNIKLSHDDDFQSVEDIRNAMIEEFAEWTEKQNLMEASADELIFEKLNAYQRVYLSHFITRWEQMEKWDGVW